MAQGGYPQGSLSAEVFAVLARQPGTYVSKAGLAGLFPGRPMLGTILARMVRRGLVCETSLGYRLVQAPTLPASWRPPEPLPEAARALLAAIVRRAHRLRGQGVVLGAAELLREAAAKIAPHPAAQDLAALADLFEHCAGLYPTLDLPKRAAA